MSARRAPAGYLFRRGAAADERSCFAVCARAMRRTMEWAHHADERAHVASSPGTSWWIAERPLTGGRARVVGYARSVVRESTWCLTEFFVSPDAQGCGIGRHLLRKCLADAPASISDRLVLASTDPSALALYAVEAGCMPRAPMLLMSGTGELGSIPAAHRAEPICADAATLDALSTLDRAAIGFARPGDHEHWIAVAGGAHGASRLFRGPRGQITGYAYLCDSFSGPVVGPDAGSVVASIAAVEAVWRDNAWGAGPFHWAVPGPNTELLRVLLEAGRTIVYDYVYTGTGLPPGLDRYACHAPLYLL